MKLYKIFLLLVSLLLSPGANGMTLTLENTIALANDSSLMAFRYRNMYQASYWQYVSYRAGRLPSLSLSLTPAKYYRYMAQRYDSQQNIDVFREQKSFSAMGGLEVAQNFDLLGGTFYLETDLE
ncbi:MAG: TolC family protein, partial [Muribaculaceae bacterium]|nr:TolC family protein [Muribaculaceae bacterium]